MSNVLFQVMPVPQVLKFEKEGNTGEADAAPLVCILYGGSQWCFYGLFAFLVTQKSGFLVLVYSNFVGAFLGFYYIWGFQNNCKNPITLRKLFRYYQVVGLLVFMQVIAITTMARQQALFFCGLVSSFCGIVGAFSLLSTLPTIIATKNSSSINRPLLCAGMLGSVLWLVCGRMLKDNWIIVPNVVCVFVQLGCCFLVWYYPANGELSPVSSPAFSEFSPPGSPWPPVANEAAIMAAAAAEVVTGLGGDEVDASEVDDAEFAMPGMVAGLEDDSNEGSMQILGETGGTC